MNNIIYLYTLGSLPTQIGSLLKLEKLNIINNYFTGAIPDEIYSLKIPEFNYDIKNNDFSCKIIPCDKKY